MGFGFAEGDVFGKALQAKPEPPDSADLEISGLNSGFRKADGSDVVSWQ